MLGENNDYLNGVELQRMLISCIEKENLIRDQTVGLDLYAPV